MIARECGVWVIRGMGSWPAELENPVGMQPLGEREESSLRYTQCERLLEHPGLELLLSVMC